MQKELPSWAIPTLAVIVVSILGLVLWLGLRTTATAAPVGRDIAVRPGMYDMRAELQKRRPAK